MDTLHCFLYVKDTILKEFTTKNKTKMANMTLFSIRQRYDFKGIHNFRSVADFANELFSIRQRYDFKGIHN